MLWRIPAETARPEDRHVHPRSCHPERSEGLPWA